MRLMEGGATLGGILTHDAMDHIMEHLSLTDCLRLREVSTDMYDSDVIDRRLKAESDRAFQEYQRLYNEWDKITKAIGTLNSTAVIDIIRHIRERGILHLEERFADKQERDAWIAFQNLDRCRFSHSRYASDDEDDVDDEEDESGEEEV